MMPGESLVATESGIGTGSVITSGSSGTNTSLVTQEVELLYWKDIKESNDIEDIQNFLAKFPLGIYADLALRRFKKLVVATPTEPTLVTPRTLKSVETDTDKTLLLPKRHGPEIETPADPAKSVLTQLKPPRSPAHYKQRNSIP